MTIAIEISICLEITQTRFAATTHIDIINSNILAAPRAAQNVVVPSLVRSRACHVPDHDVGDADTRRRVTRGAAVEVVLLDIDAVDGDVLHPNVLEQDVVDVPRGVLVCLDARAVLGVQDDRVAEDHVGYVVVRFAAHRTDRQAVAAVAVHVVDEDVVAAGDGDAVVLVDDNTVVHRGVVG